MATGQGSVRRDSRIEDRRSLDDLAAMRLSVLRSGFDRLAERLNTYVPDAFWNSASRVVPRGPQTYEV
jgi:hypothetical protein